MLSVVVPCYNEEKNLPLLAKRFSKALRGMKSELLLVNNGSTDNSQRVIDALRRKYRFVRSITVKKNVGYGHGIMMGLRHVRGSILAFTHADLQCDPWDVRRAHGIFLSQRSDKVLVKGNRKGRFSILTAGIHVLAGVLFLKKYDDINGQPKLFHKKLLRTFRNPPLGFQLDFYVQHKALENGFDIISFPVAFGRRKHGYSKWATSLPAKAGNVSRWFLYVAKLRVLGE